MSILKVAAQMERVAAQRLAATPKAKRGMFALVERRHSYMSLKDGHHAWSTYTPCIVSSASRDGVAKAVKIVGQDWPLQARDWQTITVDSQQRIAKPEAVAAALVDGDGRAIEYRDHAEAVAAIKAAAGLDAGAEVTDKTGPSSQQSRASSKNGVEEKRPVLRVVENAPTGDIGTVATRKPPRRQKNADVREREHLTPDEIERLLKTARKRGRYGQRDATMVLLAYRHGLRVGELCGLRWRDVDLEHARLFVRRLKGSESSAHPLQGDEIRMLRQLRRDWSDASGFVFTTERDAPMTPAGFRKMLSRVGAEAGLGALAHPHALRHSTGYALVDRGTDIRVVQAWLGHKAISNTVRYTTVSARRFEGVWG